MLYSELAAYDYTNLVNRHLITVADLGIESMAMQLITLDQSHHGILNSRAMQAYHLACRGHANFQLPWGNHILRLLRVMPNRWFGEFLGHGVQWQDYPDLYIS